MFGNLIDEVIPYYLCCGPLSKESSKKAYSKKRPPRSGKDYTPNACLPGNIFKYMLKKIPDHYQMVLAAIKIRR